MTVEEIRLILKGHYPFEEISHIELLQGGVSNYNYKFFNRNQQYVARVCIFEPETQINSLIPFLKYANKVVYAAPRLIQTNDGRDYVNNNGTSIVVTSYLEGDTANNFPIGTQHLKSLAQLVANFHNLDYDLQNTSITLDPDYIFNVYDRIIDYKPTDKDDVTSHLIELVDVYYKKFKREKFTDLVKNLPYGITHGDINLGNVLFEGEKAVSLLDFEELGESWQLQDIAMILVTWTFPNGKPNREFIETFITEYKLYRPLLEIEKENIINATEFIAFRQCVYAKSMMSKDRMKSAKDFSSYWTLRYLHENELTLGS